MGPFEKYIKAQKQSGDFRHIVSVFAGNISNICLLRQSCPHASLKCLFLSPYWRVCHKRVLNFAKWFSHFCGTHMAFKKNSHMELRVGENTRNNDTDIHSPSSPKARPANIVSYCSWGFLLKIAQLLLVNFHLTSPRPWFSTQRSSVQWIFPPFITPWTLTTLTALYLHKSYHL